MEDDTRRNELRARITSRLHRAADIATAHSTIVDRLESFFSDRGLQYAYLEVPIDWYRAEPFVHFLVDRENELEGEYWLADLDVARAMTQLRELDGVRRRFLRSQSSKTRRIYNVRIEPLVTPPLLPPP
jgi:hypothetical protein